MHMHAQYMLHPYLHTVTEIYTYTPLGTLSRGLCKVPWTLYVCLCMCMFSHTHVYVCVCMLMYVSVSVYIQIHTDMHTSYSYIHIHTLTCIKSTSENHKTMTWAAFHDGMQLCGCATFRRQWNCPEICISSSRNRNKCTLANEFIL